MDFYRLSTKEVLEKLDSRPLGLNSNEVQTLQKEYGRNTISIKIKVSFIKLLAAQFKSYLVWLLVVIAAVAFFAGFFLGKREHIIDGVIISLIVIINSSVGAYQDYKSEKTAQLLESMMKNEALVLRDGKKEKLDSSQLVPGDIIFLKEGNKMPADCRIMESSEFRIDESMLTGESVSVPKNPGIIHDNVALSKRKNMAYMNTFVAGGEATCIVTDIGKFTELGKIAKFLETKEKSLFLKEVDEASKKITYVALSMIVMAVAVMYYQIQDWLAVFLLGSALIIGSIPAGLPAIVTFVLALSSSKLARNNVLVKQKTLLETLGSIDVICTDKTGTLTENKMSVKKIWIDGNEIDSLEKIDKDSLMQFRNCALLCNEAKDTEKGFSGSAEDIALIDLFNDFGEDIIKFREKFPLQKMEPFSSAKKCSKSYNKVGNSVVEYMKGAPEIILEKCSYILRKGKLSAITNSDRKKILSTLDDFSGEALRNIAMSYSTRKGSVFIATVGIRDPPKKGIKEVVSTIYSANIDLKMITGDSISTAKAIAKECGFRNTKAIDGEELKDLSKEQLKYYVEEYSIFARMSPEDKVKIVSALQENGRRVAITGDGINDVPALKIAEVGVAMGRGTDIAKEAADLIILDDNLASIVKSIKEGRKIFSNIRKVINYLLTANLAEVIVVFIGALIGLMPFLAIQLLWVNFVTDIGPAIALGMDPEHKNIMSKRPTGNSEKLINKRIALLTIGISIKKAFIMMVVFLLSYRLSNSLALAQTMTFTWLVLSHFIRVATIRFDEKVSFFINKSLNWSLMIPVVFQLVIIYTPLSQYFHVVPLGIIHWIILGASLLVSIYLAKVITTLVDRNISATDKEY